MDDSKLKPYLFSSSHVQNNNLNLYVPCTYCIFGVCVRECGSMIFRSFDAFWVNIDFVEFHNM